LGNRSAERGRSGLRGRRARLAVDMPPKHPRRRATFKPLRAGKRALDCTARNEDCRAEGLKNLLRQLAAAGGLILLKQPVGRAL